ncbi:MAG: 4'-phosphopantetheinyl transferase family protein [Rhodanobacteraceae bacterium]
MPAGLEFVEANPSQTAACLDATSIHLWHIPYASAQGRAPLLRWLAAYLGVPESHVLLRAETGGKPRLAHTIAAGANHLEFNWSHSGAHALIALARGLPLGVDIEHLGKNPRALEIARRFFHPDEADGLATLEPEARNRAFISLWCAKEAVLKAAGQGLSFGLARLAFDQVPDFDWRLVRTDPALGKVADWQLMTFPAAPDCRGALAWRGGARRIFAFRPGEGGSP